MMRNRRNDMGQRRMPSAEAEAAAELTCDALDTPSPLRAHGNDGIAAVTRRYRVVVLKIH